MYVSLAGMGTGLEDVNSAGAFCQWFQCVSAAKWEIIWGNQSIDYSNSNY